jgi:rfaE bifunctional protein nucleotidyltransferase chain/domain
MIVWTNGCFDILHRGHLELFKYARTLGHGLIVGIDSDRRVRESKGESRPINSQEDRKRMLQAIRYIDEVVIFDDDEGLKKAIENGKIHTLVVGSDWEGKKVIGADLVTNVVFFNRMSGYSTTNLIEKINNGIRV